MTDQEQSVAETATTGPAWAWLYRAAAITGVAVGIFITAAGLYVLFAPPSWYTAGTDCYASMDTDMKKTTADTENQMDRINEGLKEGLKTCRPRA
ncbi:hypothetical protein [Mycobacterium avium]|nr:hypothetical protein [Mycobacterium avium]PBJ43709.1 hypothetical protein BI294_01305 [Mycobacterium avium subsp. hominissuis]QXD08167.1 hypothetical protein BB735_011845 [Mycobacterium avium subsp. hominissuis]